MEVPVLLAAAKSLLVTAFADLGNAHDLAGKCFESGQGGLTAQQGQLVVWDPDAPCPQGQSYIHAAPGSSFAPMTAGAGAKEHTYHAAEVKDAPSYAAQVGKCHATPTPVGKELTWQVADALRGGKCRASFL
ncbi:unnamed protein product [Effrenium voratum]|uniref:Uncharacterized protein n=1 Tax=Effrenium voratum TaxID=2562239 RepID=A0AA36N9D0_9DINO|nr:unnamed protein product [Effrenium voratum]